MTVKKGVGMDRLKYVYYTGILTIALSSCAKDQSIVDNLLYHEGSFSDRIVFYLMPVSAKPVLKQEVLKTEGSKKIIQITLDCSKSHSNYTSFMTNELRNKLKNIQSHTHADAYAITNVDIDNNKIIRITIAYDEYVCTIEATMCDAISLKNACIINIYYTDAIRMSESHNPILKQATKNNPQEFMVALDCGHGGADFGKIGCANTVEKNITLSLGRQVAGLLQQKGFKVCMTRSDDRMVELDMRTKIANRYQADLLVSIHANSGPKEAKGIETYWNPKVPLRPVNSKKKYILDEMLCSLDTMSNSLAHSIHTHILNSVKKKYPLHDRSIKKAVCQVLLGADMPAALVEVGFLSNECEARMLSDEKFQRLIASSICLGIEQYCKKIINKDSFTNSVA